MAHPSKGSEVWLGVDVGGSGIRCLFVDRQTGESMCRVRPLVTRAAPGGGVDLDLEASWQELARAIGEGLEASGLRAEQVAGVGLTSMRFGSVVLGERDRVLLAAPNHDARGVGAALELAAQHGEAIEASTGHWPAPIGTAPRLLGLAVAKRARVEAVLSVNDWLGWRMTGERATDPSQASGTLLYDLGARGWSPEWVEHVGIPEQALPPIRHAGDRLGDLADEPARQLGLAPRTPIAVGGGDTQMGLLGLGALDAGQAGAVCGTTLPVQSVVAGAPPLRPGCWVEPHVIPERFVVESNAGPVGAALDWLGRLLSPEAANGAAWLLAEGAAGDADAGGMLSTFGAQLGDTRSLDLPMGELSLSHLVGGDPTRARTNLARAVVEGMAFAVRANWEHARHDPSETLVLGGGMSDSASWCATVAAACDRSIDVGVRDASALGAALCGAVAAGGFRDLREAAGRHATRRRVEPAAEHATLLEERFQLWQRVQAARLPMAVHTRGAAVQALLRGAGQGPAASSRPDGLRILVTADMDRDALDRLAALGEVEYASYRDARRLLTGPTLVEALQGFDVFITEIDLVDGASLLALPELRVVASCRGDAVNVDVEACSILGVPVLNAPGRNADAVADLTLAFLLALARKLPEANAFLREPDMQAGDMGAMGRAYGTLRGHELGGRQVGLVGLGAVGRKVARRLRAFGAEVLVYDPWQSPEAIRRIGGEPVALDALLARSDFVSLHAAVTEESTGLIDAAALARMKPEAFLVNTARAALVDEAALVEALEAGRLAGAALDVFSEEPPGSDHPLLARADVIATPHIGGNTHQVGVHQGRIISEGLAQVLSGQPSTCLLNPEVAKDWAWDRARSVPDEATCAALRERPPPAVTDLQKKKPRRTAAAPVAASLEPAAPERASPEPAAPSVDPGRREAVRPVLERFVTGFREDPAAARIAVGQDVTLHFVLSDVELDFHLRLREGRVAAALGPPDAEPEVVLRLEADVLDRMFGGSSRAMDEAMAGHLSFSGDAAKAMTLQQLEDDLIRPYRAAAKG